MNPRLSAAIQAFTPPIVWNALQRRRGRAGIFPWREFGFMATWANAEPLLEGKLAALYAKYGPLDPISPPEKNLYRSYNLCCFANLCREVPGDFVCAGVSWGVMPRIVFDFVDLASLGKVLHLIDPFEGTIASTGRHAHTFNSDPDYVLRQYPQSAPIKLHRTTIPLRLPQKLAFVFTDTGDPAADAAALPIFFEGLSPGGIFITEQYANNIEYYAPVLAQLRVSPLWLPSGQGVIFKQ
jgi:hypothetical protein